MAYVPLNLEVYTAAYAGAIAGIGVPDGAFIINPNQSHYVPVTVVAAAFAQAFDTAWGATPAANLYDIEAIAEACCNTFVKGPGAPMSGDVTTQANWTITATAIVALIKAGDAAATTGGIIFPSPGGGVLPSTSHMIFISSIYGSDTSGTGTFSNPYATIAKAYSVITTASALEVWDVIVLPGTYTANVAIRPFIRLVGWDPSLQILENFYPVHIVGNLTLDGTFSTAGSIAALTNIGISGTVTLNFSVAGSADGIVSFTNCQVTLATLLQMGDANIVEYSNTNILDDLTQTGGQVVMTNSGSSINGTTLRIEGVPLIQGSSTIFTGSNGNWSGSVTIDGSAIEIGSGMDVTLSNFTLGDGLGSAVSIISSADGAPNVVSNYGATLENPSLVGPSGGLPSQMRVTEQFLLSNGTPIAATSTTPIAFTVNPLLLGVTSIEDLLNIANCIGAGWTDICVTHNCSVTFQFVKNGADNQVIANIYNPGAGFNIGDSAVVNWGAYKFTAVT